MRVTLSLDEIEGFPEVTLVTDDRMRAVNAYSEIDGAVRELLEIVTRIYDKRPPF